MMLQGRCQQVLRNVLPYTNLSSRCQVTVSQNEQLRNENAKPFWEIPGPTGLFTIPYLGTYLTFKSYTKFTNRSLPNLVNNLRNKYGDIHTLTLGKSKVVLIHHPDYVKTLFKQPYKLFMRPTLDLIEVFHRRNVATRTLTILKGKEWESLRKPAQEKMLRPAVVASYAPLIGGVTNDFVRRLRHRGNIDDLLQELMKYTTESVCMLCFNRRFGCLEDGPPAEIIQHIQSLFECLQESFYAPVKTFLYFRTKMYKEFETARLNIDRIVSREINRQVEYLKELEKDGKLEEYLEKEPNFMYSLMSDPRMADESVNGIVISLISAGIDSTANSLVFALADLALHPDKQETAFREVQSVLSDSPELTKEHLAKMHYIKACVKESQRKTFPVMLGPVRVTEFDVVIGGYRIPPGKVVITNMSAMCMDERFFPRPNEFIPERWLRDTDKEIAKGQDFPFASQPFGHGPRGCLGQRFAEIEMYIALAKILQNFEVKLPAGVTKVKSIYRTFASPAEKVEMNFVERKLN